MKIFQTQGKEARLRRAPDHTSEVIVTLPEGTKVEVLEEKGRFLFVRVRDDYQPEVRGYLPAGFVRGYKAVSPPEDEPSILLEPCHRCGGEEWVEHPLFMQASRLYIPLGFFSTAPIMVRVCLHCGLVEMCVSRESLSELRTPQGKE